MSFPVPNPQLLLVPCQAGSEGCEQGVCQPQGAEVQCPLPGKRTQISEPAGGCRGAGSCLQHSTYPCLSTCSLVWRKPLGLSCPPKAWRKYGQDIFLGTGISSTTGLHMLPDPSKLPPPGTANHFFLPLHASDSTGIVWIFFSSITALSSSNCTSPVPVGVTEF